MLFYLDNWTNTKQGYDPRDVRQKRVAAPGRQSRRQRTQRRRLTGNDNETRRRVRRGFGLNENYARELLELHTLGVHGGYDQRDVVQVARAFTGWSVVTPELARRHSEMRERISRRSEAAASRLPELAEPGQFFFNSDAHDDDPKSVLRTPVQDGGRQDGLHVLRILSRHRSTARFISTKLAQRFVTDSPSHELIEDLSNVFVETDGDIAAILRHLFVSEAFVAEGLSSAKVKTPFELVVSAARATEARIEGPGVLRTLQSLGMAPYLCQPPTGYDETSEPWLSAGSLLSRSRFASELAHGRIRGLAMPAPADIEAWIDSVSQALVSSPSDTALDQERKRLASTVRELMAASADSTAVGHSNAVALLLASPQFQKQ